MAHFLKCGDCYYCPAHWCNDEDTKNCPIGLIKWLQNNQDKEFWEYIFE